MLSMSARLALVALCGAVLWGCTQPLDVTPPPPPNTPPRLTLGVPAGGQQVRAGRAVALSASVEDAEDGDTLADRVVWVSSLSGQLARGAQTSGAFAEPGEQTLTATVIDSGGAAASASIPLVVLTADAPTAAVRKPAAGVSLMLGEVFELGCEALSAQDAPLAGDAVRWTSALSGPLPSGASVRASLAVAGEDTLTCTATDPATGVSTSATVRVTVRPVRAPTVFISRPESTELFVKAGEPAPASPTVSFRATAQDFQAAGGPGNLDATIQWTLQPGSVSLGTGPAIAYTFTTPGAYTVTARATDGQGHVAEDSVRVRLVTNLPPRCDISQPRDDNARLPLKESTRLEGTCVDPETGTPLEPTWMTSASAQALGTGASISASLETSGPQRLSACAADPEDPTLVGCAERSVRAITNTAPQDCAVLAPLASSVVPAGTAVTLEGAASDAEDPQATLRYTWTSSRDGELTLGARATTHRLVTAGSHSLTLTVTDPWGLSCSTHVNVRVNGAPRLDALVVKQGANDCLKQTCREAQDITVSGGATDAPEGVARQELLDGVSGGFGTSTRANISATLAAPVTARHTVVLRATDADGAVGRVAATFNVLPTNNARLATPLFDTGQPVAALSVGAGDVRYVDGAASTVFRHADASANLSVGGPALALFELTGASGPVFFVGTPQGVERCVDGTCTRYSGGPLADVGNRVNAVAAVGAPDLLLLGTDKGLVLTRASDPATGGKPGTVVGQRVLKGLKVRQVVISPVSTPLQVKAWVATNEGLAEVTLHGEDALEPAIASVSTLLHVPPAVPSEDVLCVAVSPEGRVFAGTSKGFSALGEEGPALKAAPWLLPDDGVQALLFERRTLGTATRDLLWAGTRSGLVRYDIALDIPTRFGAEEGLPGEDIRSLAVAPDGTRYIGTARGLATYAGP